MEFWIALWKYTLIVSLSIFFIVAVVVTYFGALDIKKLFKTLDEEHQANSES